MAIASPQRMTLEEYLDYDEGTGVRYELLDGELVEMGAETDQNVLIALFLIVAFANVVPLKQLRRGTEIELPQTSGNQDGPSSRYPDFMVLTAAGAAELQGDQRSLVRTSMATPLLVVEVVSPGEPGEKNYDRDYVEKRREYAARGIPEYWIVDAYRGVVLVLTLVDSGSQDGRHGERQYEERRYEERQYEERRFVGKEAIASPNFPALSVTAEQVIKAD